VIWNLESGIWNLESGISNLESGISKFERRTSPHHSITQLPIHPIPQLHTSTQHQEPPPAALWKNQNSQAKQTSDLIFPKVSQGHILYNRHEPSSHKDYTMDSVDGFSQKPLRNYYNGLSY
jgi:hypothetical protein